MPETQENFDGWQAAAALRRARWHFGQRSLAEPSAELTDLERGLLRRLFRALLAPASTWMDWYDGKPDARLLACVAWCGALPTLLFGRLVWAPVDGDPPCMDWVAGGPVVLLRDRPSRLEREYARERAELIGTATSGEPQLTGYQVLAGHLGAKLVRQEDLAEVRHPHEPDDSDPAQWLELLEERMPAIVAVLEQNPRVPDDAVSRVSAALEALTPCRALSEVILERAPRPVPSAWDESCSALLVDVDRIRPDPSHLRHLAWGLARATGGDEAFGELVVVLDVPLSDLKSTLLALGVRIDSRGEHASSQRDRAGRRLRLEGLSGSPLPAALTTSRVLTQGLLDAPALRALAGEVPEGFRFRPLPRDLDGGIPRGLRRLAVAMSIGDLDAAVAAQDQVSRLVMSSHRIKCGRVLSGPELPEALTQVAVWLGEDDGFLDAAALSLADGALLDRLLGDDGGASAAARAAAIRTERRTRKQRARKLQRAQLRDATRPIVPTVLAASVTAVPAGQSGRGAGPSVQARSRGEAGEVSGLGDVLTRLLQHHRDGGAEERLRDALVVLHGADGLLTKARRELLPSVEDLCELLDGAVSGDEEALDKLEGWLDVSQIHGPGFDLLDPYGLFGAGTSDPARVELKTTVAPLQPGGTVRVRLTVNEARRSLERTDVPYLLRIYHDPGDDALPILAAELASPMLSLSDEPGARNMLACVRGGYLFLEVSLGG